MKFHVTHGAAGVPDSCAARAFLSRTAAAIVSFPQDCPRSRKAFRAVGAPQWGGTSKRSRAAMHSSTSSLLSRDAVAGRGPRLRSRRRVVDLLNQAQTQPPLAVLITDPRNDWAKVTGAGRDRALVVMPQDPLLIFHDQALDARIHPVGH